MSPNAHLPSNQINKQYSFSSYHVVKELKLKELSKIFEQRPFLYTPLVLAYEFGKNAFCFIYNFGSVVFFNLSTVQQTKVINNIQNHLDQIFDLSVMDEYYAEENPKEKNQVNFNGVILDKITKEKIEMVSLALAQSTALEFFEKKVDVLLEEANELTVIAGRKTKKISEKAILKIIKQIIAINQNIVVLLRLLEKPESAWEKKVLDNLYEAAMAMFELKERYQSLKEKLFMIQRNLEVLHSFSVNRKMIILEAAIVGLFILDVLVVLYEVFLK